MDAPFWPSRFKTISPIDGTLAVAQAKVFNNKSFGLWTQDWQVQLMPVTRIVPQGDNESWVSMLQAGIGDAGAANVSPDELEIALKYLSCLDPEMATIFMNH